ncbi:aminotransferase class I/II-fold pyridoxal phosphate-dependent enzyme [Hazenella coriacea]|uniref:Arginine/lysine/ornithine decarboxylase n=1 Tax=Hazenella coriacea TaxID=1179467 RepID=A0A4R3L445_9BACL|nr:aminotransferase class I/II-fold pyridoxal phosphate-dependent enzyme [Hazenella coriacea]TCS94329.1 arginine/lysine/ornithine decarboxylase [Hazenella coriacea]
MFTSKQLKLHQRVPLLEAILRHRDQACGNFHVPGHKQGKAFDSEAKQWFHPLLQLDLTETGHLDDLHDPTGVILEAQQLAADAFGAEHTLFLVGGTTAGILASILSTCQPGDLLIIQRSCHQSVFHGCMLAGVTPIYLPSSFNSHTGLEESISLNMLAKVIEKYPEAKGVVVTSPSYYGMTQPLANIATLCHQYGMPLIVDEAHGAHFRFHPKLPMTALESGADMVIQSTHKMLTSMTMSSMLHIQGDHYDLEEISRWLRMIESSSPSYPLMASLDATRRFMVSESYSLFDNLFHHLDYFRGNISKYRHLEEVKLQDPCKLSLQSKKVSGYFLQDWLGKRGYYTELADHNKVLFVFTLGTEKKELDDLLSVLDQLEDEISSLSNVEAIDLPSFPLQSEAPISFLELKKKKRVLINLEDALGECCSEMIVPYPPGIPFLLPGERFSKEAINYLHQMIQLGAQIRGIKQSSSLQVYVLQ